MNLSVADRTTSSVHAGEHRPLASVVIVCYNQAHYLPEAIKSALAQTYCPLEVLVIDDGSSDDTALVAQSCSSVRYVRQNNSGLAAARNAGLRHSLGEFIAFLDADDKLLPNAVLAGADCFRRVPEAAFVYGAFRNVLSDGSPGAAADVPRVQSDHYRHLLEGNFIGMHGTVLYRRAALESSGGFDETLPACEDYDLYLRIARRAPVEGHSEIVAEYRQHDTNMSRDHAFMLKNVRKVLDRERSRLPDSSYRKALRTGVRVWGDYYGPQVFDKWRYAPTWSGMIEISRLWPRGLARHAAGYLRRRLSSLVPKRSIDFGSFRRCTPVSALFGFDRGLPIDRHYIEMFLSTYSACVKGRVLEIGDDTYSRRFGGDAITHQDVLHVVPGSAGATIIADLASAAHIPSESFDCVILTQTLHYIFDLQRAVATLHRILKPGGVLLVTMPGISRICRDQQDTESDCWRFTAASARKMFSPRFGSQNVQIHSYGNVKTAVAFLEGLAAEDLDKTDLQHHDPDFQVTIAVAAWKEAQQ